LWQNKLWATAFRFQIKLNGLCPTNLPPITEQWVRTFIVTTKPNEVVASLHDRGNGRFPAVLNVEPANAAPSSLPTSSIPELLGE
jgi:hypothetical protein